MDSLTLTKIQALNGSVQLVGSKSLTNRALLLSALSAGTTKLSNILRSDDTAVMLDALQRLGVQVDLDPNQPDVVTITSAGGPFGAHHPLTTDPDGVLELFLGNAGTAMRPLCAALALSHGKFRLVGEPRMYERPIGELVSALQAMGAKITYLEKAGYPPLLIEGLGLPAGGGSASGTAAETATAAAAPSDGRSQLLSLAQHQQALSLQIDGSTSSQFISAVLMVSTLLPCPVDLKIKGELISKPYVNLTCEMLRSFGVQVDHDPAFTRYSVKPGTIQAPSSYLVEGDASGATYFLAGAAIKGEVTVKGIGQHSIQGDVRFVDILEQMGAQVTWGPDFVKVKAAPTLHGVDLDLNDMPDAAMTLVPMALFTDSPVVIRNIGSWRVKETDRIAAMATEMRKLGCTVEEGADYIKVDGSTQSPVDSPMVAFDTYNDHRMAMCMSLVALQRDVIINDPQCCRKTFPDYFERLAKISIRD